MDTHERQGNFYVRIMKMESNIYSMENPNPHWQNLGEKWVQFALSECREGVQYEVAYIPHIPIEIKQGNTIHNVLPTYWDSDNIKDDLKVCNFTLGGGNNLFRLNARYKSPLNPYVGSRENVDLSPIGDKQAILELLKLAEKIYPPGTIWKT